MDENIKELAVKIFEEEKNIFARGNRFPPEKELIPWNQSITVLF